EPVFVILARLQSQGTLPASLVQSHVRHTIDANGHRKRREWTRLGHKHFEFICGSSSQAHTGLKKALQEGYIVRRPYHGGFEYSMKWREFQRAISDIEVPLI